MSRAQRQGAYGKPWEAEASRKRIRHARVSLRVACCAACGTRLVGRLYGGDCCRACWKRGQVDAEEGVA